MDWRGGRPRAAHGVARAGAPRAWRDWETRRASESLIVAASFSLREPDDGAPSGKARAGISLRLQRCSFSLPLSRKLFRLAGNGRSRLRSRGFLGCQRIRLVEIG